MKTKLSIPSEVRWMLRLPPLHDAPELLPTIAFCNGALDQHIFHGAFENYVDLATTGRELPLSQELSATPADHLHAKA